MSDARGRGKAGYTAPPLSQDADILDVAKALFDLGAGGVRGVTASTLGFPGDLESLLRLGPNGRTTPPLLPTTDDILAKLPSTNSPEGDTYSKLSSNLPIPTKTGAMLGGMAAGLGSHLPQAGLNLGLGKDLLLQTKFPADAMRVGEGIRKELYSPSLGITSLHNPGAELVRDFGDSVLIPRQGAFSPRENNALFNRDVYTPRYSYFDGGSVEKVAERARNARLYGNNPAPRKEAVNRLVDRGLAAPPAWLTRKFNIERGGLMQESHSPGLMHQLAAEASPRFQSFDHFINDPRGAGNLQGGAGSYYYKSADIERRMNEALANIPVDLRPSINQRSDITKLLQNPDFTPEEKRPFQQILKDLERIPSDYAELKARGPVAINPENFAGALIGENVSPDFIRKLQDTWRIPVTQAGSTEYHHLAREANDIQNSVPARRTNEPSKFFLNTPRGRGLDPVAKTPPEVAVVQDRLMALPGLQKNYHSVFLSPETAAVAEYEQVINKLLETPHLLEPKQLEYVQQGQKNVENYKQLSALLGQDTLSNVPPELYNVFSTKFNEGSIWGTDVELLAEKMAGAGLPENLAHPELWKNYKDAFDSKQAAKLSKTAQQSVAPLGATFADVAKKPDQLPGWMASNPDAWTPDDYQKWVLNANFDEVDADVFHKIDNLVWAKMGPDAAAPKTGAKGTDDLPPPTFFQEALKNKSGEELKQHLIDTYGSWDSSEINKWLDDTAFSDPNWQFVLDGMVGGLTQKSPVFKAKK